MYVFENLNIYNQALRLAAGVELVAESFPPSTNYFTDRLNKAAGSISAHVAEAHGHWKEEECRDFFWKAREGTQECAGLLDIAARQGLISEGLKISFRLKLDNLHKLILDAIRNAEKKTEKSVPELAETIGLKVL